MIATIAGIPDALLAAVLVACGALGAVICGVVVVVDWGHTRSIHLPLAWAVIACGVVALLGLWVLA